MGELNLECFISLVIALSIIVLSLVIALSNMTFLSLRNFTQQVYSAQPIRKLKSVSYQYNTCKNVFGEFTRCLSSIDAKIIFPIRASS